MNLTMPRTCGFLPVVCEQSHTSARPGIRWKLRNSAITLNKWQANSYTTPMIKQMTSVAASFVTKVDGAVWMWDVSEGAGLSGCWTEEAAPPQAAPQWQAGSWPGVPGSTRIGLRSLSNVQSRELRCATPKDLLTWHSIKSKCCWTCGRDLWCLRHPELSQGSVINYTERPHPQMALGPGPWSGGTNLPRQDIRGSQGRFLLWHRALAERAIPALAVAQKCFMYALFPKSLLKFPFSQYNRLLPLLLISLKSTSLFH